MKPERLQLLPPNLSTWSLDGDVLYRRWKLSSARAASALAHYLDKVVEHGGTAGKIHSITLEVQLGEDGVATTDDLHLAEAIEDADHDRLIAPSTRTVSGSVRVLGYPFGSGGG